MQVVGAYQEAGSDQSAFPLRRHGRSTHGYARHCMDVPSRIEVQAGGRPVRRRAMAPMRMPMAREAASGMPSNGTQ
ncbi:hypothetical protein M878_10335 [Streptomyces roseochromogenus subsp. oscitans DS 12.976]|uniref:Uncharacterized protein n=1 Tax=Streptomyces roseochromogenus subsp. oscitans DS 12.976 TaxID=1352936 RepID=V6KZH9_STRRC|nr:hypothetical protein M878_10335 [Streptomyces roseochromogenus subsp. oscitans DS 12.976]